MVYVTLIWIYTHIFYALNLFFNYQVPATQRNVINQGDAGDRKNVLGQLGTIRMQLQREQLRMDEIMRQRGKSHSKAVNFH